MHGLHDPHRHHGECGVGFLARLDAQPTHEVIRDAVSILKNLEHRGAVGGDQSTGDGAGILLQIPDAFFRRELAALGLELPPAGAYSAGMIFLPPATPLAAF